MEVISCILYPSHSHLIIAGCARVILIMLLNIMDPVLFLSLIFTAQFPQKQQSNYVAQRSQHLVIFSYVDNYFSRAFRLIDMLIGMIKQVGIQV